MNDSYLVFNQILFLNSLAEYHLFSLCIIKIIQFMPKKTKKTLPTCEFSQTVSVSFCDSGSDKSSNKSKKFRNCQSLDCPIFINDKNFATPTFILCSQKEYYDQRGFKMREQHKKKMFQYTDQKDSLNIPKPRTRNNFCSVCRQMYEDYLNHIESEKHKKKINNSIFNQYILELTDKFNSNPKNNFHLSYNTLSTRDQDDVEVIQNRPLKKVKIDYEIDQLANYQKELKKSLIVPPPHLDLSNPAYFPGLSHPMNYLLNPIHSYPVPQSTIPQIAYKYMFFNTIFPPNPYGMMNPYFNYFRMPPISYCPCQKMKQNSPMNEQTQQKPERSAFQNNNYAYQKQQKNQFKRKEQQVIVIDDDEEKMEKPQVMIEIPLGPLSKMSLNGVDGIRLTRFRKKEISVDNMQFFS